MTDRPNPLTDPATFTVHPRNKPRCWCGRLVPASLMCRCCCAEHDHVPARMDERYDPSPEPIDRKTR